MKNQTTRSIARLPTFIRRASCILLLFIGSALGLADKSLPSLASLPTLNLVLTPDKDVEGHTTGIAVDYTLSDSASSGDKPFALEFNTLEPMLRRVTDQMRHLEASDSQGRLPLAAPVRRRVNGSTYQVWQSLRPSTGPIHVSYVVPVALHKPLKRGPHIDLQAAGDGLSGAFTGFLCVPRTGGLVRAQVHWVLSPGQIAVSSYGLGDFQQELSYDALGTTLFLAGSLQTYPSPPRTQGFGMYSLGLSRSALETRAQWTLRAYDIERSAFNGSPAAPFRLMVRSYDGGPIMSGRAAYHSFLLYLPAGKDSASRDIHDLVAHEMVHALIEDFDAAPGDDGDWYTEGTADYFKLTLPYSGGLYTPREYLKLVNGEAAEYYSNALATVPNHGLSNMMWSGRNAWTVPYARGALYFADLEEKLKRHGSIFHVLDLVNETSKRIRNGEPAAESTWIAVLEERAGTWAFSDWQEMMTGKLLMPDPSAFGECFIGIPIQAGIFNLGFRMPVRLQAGSTIRDVINNSPAARAGLRNGDTIGRDIDTNPIAASFHDPIHLPIVRNANHLDITYDPHIGSRQGMRWEPRSGDPDHPCPR